MARCIVDSRSLEGMAPTLEVPPVHFAQLYSVERVHGLDARQVLGTRPNGICFGLLPFVLLCHEANGDALALPQHRAATGISTS